MHLVLIETSGNQNYIFATNKLRENVGASELTYQIGTKLVLEAAGRGYSYEKDSDGNQLRRILLDEKPIEDPSNKNAEEIIVATSGKALLLTRTPERAKEIVRGVTTRALKEMPGLTVHGAIEKVDDNLREIHDGVVRVHHKLENLRYRIPSNQQRLLRLPHVEPCATSGLPATSIEKFEPLARPYSAISLSKRRELPTEADKGRISEMLETVFDIELPRNFEKFEEVFPKTKWLAVVHADGNGLGELFLKFDKHLRAGNDGRKYINAYRMFSIALDISTVNAAGYALKNLQMEVTKDISEGEVPVIPLVLGGDDLTILCDGEYALKFTKDFLEQFERETATLNKTPQLRELKKDQAFAEVVQDLQLEASGERKNVIPYIADRAFGAERLGICAGVAIVKPHYPFHQAYELAEQLLRSAKQVKTKVTHQPNGKEAPLPCSAMDFHVLYDSRGIELHDIREKLVVPEKDGTETQLFAKPYVVTDLKEQEPLDRLWLVPRKWSELETRVCTMCDKDADGRRKLPNSQMHVIRESLHRGKAETDSEVDLFSHRYKAQGLDTLLWKKDKPQSLFFEEKHAIGADEVEVHTTHFLDALDVVDFWKGFECSRAEQLNGSADRKSKNGGAQ